MPDSDLENMAEFLNLCFRPGKALEQLAETQKHSNIFGPEYSLVEAYEYCHMIPSGDTERQNLVDYFNALKVIPSPVMGLSSHDLLRQTLQENLESANPLPVCFVVADTPAEDFVLQIAEGPIPWLDDKSAIIASIGMLPGTPKVKTPAPPGEPKINSAPTRQQRITKTSS